ncbi:MAG TPA: hypothetical protein VMF09_08515 [Solirubrobacteraceae bacterium]|nr:hypothetical protein [Solirubrobacteraceae bacterium]
MVRKSSSPTQEGPASVAHRCCTEEQLAILRWTAGLGAVTAEALAHRGGLTLASARSRLASAERAGMLRRSRLLAAAPALYTATPAGLRACGARGFQPCRVSVANAPHAIACAAAAAALERAYPDHRLMGEPELRHDEREAGAALASAQVGEGPRGAQLLHRPDLVLWPDGPHELLPVAIEVELTVKAPQRLLAICMAWARCRCVAGTVYLAAAGVQRPLARAIERAGANERIALVPVDVVAVAQEGAKRALARSIPGAA